MNYKLHREEYYDEDYSLNKQEEKEFMMPLQDAYWLIRAKAFLLEIPIFGDKSTIKRNYEILLFNLNNTAIDIEKVIPSQSEAKQKANLDLLEKKFGILNEIYKNDNIIESLPGYKTQVSPIYNYIPELKLMKKNLSYPEIYQSISRLADSQMVFINMFKQNPNNNLISGIIYFPFTPSILEHPNINSEFIYKLSKFFNLHCNYNISFENEKIKILKQKLLDLFYLVEDSEDLHGVTNCQSLTKQCENISSFYCENHMCKLCCEFSVTKEFCIIHDDLVNFYRNKMQDLLQFEHRKSFDRSTTVRISIRQRITKNELKNIFEENGINLYNVNWENLEFTFRKGIEKIQFIYLICNSNEDARKLYEDRLKIIQKWEKLELNIQSLMENVEDILLRVDCIQTSALIVVPITNIISNYKKIPKKSNRNKEFAEMIEKCLNITTDDYKLSNCQNKINNEFSYDYYLVQFKDKIMLDMFYNSQPFMDSLIVHKLCHLKFFPMLRNKIPHKLSQSLCVNCNNEINKDCVFELCTICCSRQNKDNLIINKINLKCECNLNNFNEDKIIPNINKLIKDEFIQKCKICYSSNPYDFDFKCYNVTELCEQCCHIQMFPNKNCIIHTNRISMYTKINKICQHDFNFQKFINNYQLNLSQIKLKLMTNLKNGEFHWYRPIEETNLTRLMLDMNKELMIIMDNPNFRREGPLRINDKMYKIFTYQNEEILRKNYSKNNLDDIENLYTTEGFDKNGDFFIEYNFTNDSLNEYQPDCFVHSSVDKLESLELKNYEKDLSELSNKFKDSFHLILYGLDIVRYSHSDLIEEIFIELKSEVGKINKDDIHLLDEQSVINCVLINNPNFYNYEKFSNLGRFALIKFKNEKDALKLFLEKCRISLPLCNGKKGIPSMMLGEFLKKYLDDNK